NAGFDNIRITELRAERTVESPAGIDAAVQQDMNHQNSGNDIEIPAQQVDSRERQIFGPDHQRNEEISQNRRHNRDQEEEHHDHAVRGENLVVRVGVHQVALGREQLQADQHGVESAEEKEERDRDEVQHRDPLMVGGQKPRPERKAVGQVVRLL